MMAITTNSSMSVNAGRSARPVRGETDIKYTSAG